MNNEELKKLCLFTDTLLVMSIFKFEIKDKVLHLKEENGNIKGICSKSLRNLHYTYQEGVV